MNMPRFFAKQTLIPLAGALAVLALTLGFAPPAGSSPARSSAPCASGTTAAVSLKGGSPKVAASLKAAGPPRAAVSPKTAVSLKATASRSHGPSYMTGIGDNQSEMFSNPMWCQLHTQIARDIVPYDAAVRPYSLQLARAWIKAAEAAHQRVLVAFYHSEYTPMQLPSVGTYERDVQKFIRLFPHVREYQAWDEANRGYIPHYLTSPSAVQDALYYRALKRSCLPCTVVGLDVLDQQDIYPTLEYIAEFKREIYRLHSLMPSVWGLHDYSDLNRFESWRTRELTNVLGGEVWLTETGGIVKFGGAFPNNRGSGIRRAARVLQLMFRVAAANPRVKRLYIYDWTGGNSRTRFDAGLMSAQYKPRPGYVVVCRQLHAAHCNLRTANN